MRRTLEQVVLTSMHPRLGITVVVQIVSADGAVEACAANAACAALMDAGVPMRGVLCAASCAILPPRLGGGVGERGPVPVAVAVADPTEEEERAATAVATMSYCFRGGKAGGDFGDGGEGAPPSALPEAEAEVLQTTTRGVMSEEDFLGLTVLGRDAAYSVFHIFKASARRFHASKDLEIEGMAEAAKAAVARSKEMGQGAGFRRSFGGGVSQSAAAGEATDVAAA